MKKILTILLMLISVGLFGQLKDEFPKYMYDSTSKTMTVVFTLEQARTIDNDYDYLDLLELSRKGCDSLAKSYQILVMDMGRVIAQQDITIKDYIRLDVKNNQLINNLNEQIKKYIEDQLKCELLIKNQDYQLNSYKKEIRKLKIKKTVGIFTLGGVTIGLTTYIILDALGVIHK
jgi:hypothetical protein